MVWLRWIGDPSPMITIRPGTSRSRCSQKATIVRIHGVVLAMEIPLALRRHRTDDGEVIAGPPFPQDRRVPHRGIGVDDTRQGIKARLIYEEDRLLLRFRPFLIAGHVSVRQRAIAASSRWRARRMGF